MCGVCKLLPFPSPPSHSPHQYHRNVALSFPPRNTCPTLPILPQTIHMTIPSHYPTPLHPHPPYPYPPPVSRSFPFRVTTFAYSTDYTFSSFVRLLLSHCRSLDIIAFIPPTLYHSYYHFCACPYFSLSYLSIPYLHRKCCIPLSSRPSSLIELQSPPTPHNPKTLRPHSKCRASPCRHIQIIQPIIKLNASEKKTQSIPTIQPITARLQIHSPFSILK